jgi:aspartyl protease family protein
MNKPVYFALAMVVAMGLVAQGIGSFAPSDEIPAAARSANRLAGETQSTAREAGDAGDALEIVRDSSGQFRFNAAVNGQDANFLVDTGADMVALTVAEAQRLGFDIDPESFEPIGQTASGVGYGTELTIDSIDVGGSEIRNVHAVVMDGLSENLLGQSVLGKLDGVELRGDRMLIHRR